MSTNTESSSINCTLCGQPIAPGEPAHAILTGLYVSGSDKFEPHGKLGFACGCLLRAAERHADHKPVFADEFANAEEYVEHIKCMNAATEPDKEQRYVKCPKCYCGKWVNIDYEGPLSCKDCGWVYFTQPHKFIQTAHIVNQDDIDGILNRPAFNSNTLLKEKINITRGRCPLCNRDIEPFRNALSEKEFKISGMCQSCQDETFGKN